MDGTPTLRLNEFILASLAHNKVDLGAPRSNSTGANLPQPVELKFELDATCEKYINEACQHFHELVDQHEMQVSAGSSEIYQGRR